MKIQKEIKKGFESYEFPFSESEIEGILKKLPAKDLEGLKEIVITPPIKNKDHKRFGRYLPGKILLFAHRKVNGKFEIDLGYKTLELTLEEFKNRAHQATLHEIGHHVGIINFGDDSETFANDYQSENLTKYFPDALK